MSKRRTLGDEAKLLTYFQQHPDTPISISALARAIGSDAKNLSRRVRALRPKGWVVHSHNDLPKQLKTDEYLFPSGQNPAPPTRKILSQRARAEVFERDGSVCQRCGLAAGEIDPETGRRVILQVHHLNDLLPEPQLNELQNLELRCRACNEGQRHFGALPPDVKKVKALLKACSYEVRKQVYWYLREQFDPKQR